MKKRNGLFRHEISWTILKDRPVLKSGGEKLIRLKEKKSGGGSFQWQGGKYALRNEGFWNPSTIIEKDGHQILHLTRPFLGSKGTIIFAGGNKYICKVRDAFPVKLAFFSEGDKEVLSYTLDPSVKSNMKLKIADYSLSEAELIMLIVVGCFSFRGISRELNALEAVHAAAHT